MRDVTGMAGIFNDICQVVDKTGAFGHFSQQKHSGIRGHLLSGEIRDHLFSGSTCKWKRKLGIFSHAVHP